VNLGGELPAQVHRVQQAQVQALPVGREVEVRGVAGEQDPPGPVPLGLPGGVAEPGCPEHLGDLDVVSERLPHQVVDLFRGHRGVPVDGQVL